MSDTGRPTVLFLGGASPIGSSLDIGGSLVRQARSRGLGVHLTNTAAALERTTEITALTDAVYPVDPEDVPQCLAWAHGRRARGDHYDAVFGLRDQVVLAAAEVADAFGAAGNPSAAVRRARNKDECRAVLRAAGLRQPGFRLCAGLDEAAEFLSTGPGPWVVKPRDGMASIGVRLVTGPAELAEAVGELPDPGPFLVEEYVSGPEFSAEGVFIGGRAEVLAVVAKQKFDPPHFVEAGHTLPAELPAGAAEEIAAEVRAALAALGLRFGVFHVELWLTKQGVVLGEVHPRPGGDWLHVMLGHAIPGLELFGLVLDDVLGRPLPADRTPTRGAAARFLTAPPGRLVRADGWDEVLAHPAVLRAELAVPIGGEIRPVRESGDRPGVIVVGAETPREAATLATHLAAAVTLVVA